MEGWIELQVLVEEHNLDVRNERDGPLRGYLGLWAFVTLKKSQKCYIQKQLKF